MALNGVYFKVLYCASACIMAIQTVPMNQVCVYRSAWFGYHSALQNKDGSESPTTMNWERGTAWIAKGYADCQKK